MDKGNEWGNKFANSTDDFEYYSMENLCKKRSIPKPKTCNFDGFLKGRDSEKLIPFEHTEAVQNPADYVLEKTICTDYKSRKPLKIPESTRSNQIFKAVEKKHKKSEGYFECVTCLEKHGVLCSQEAFLLIILYIPYNCPLYQIKNFEEDVDLLSGCILLERKHKPSFFSEIHYGVNFQPLPLFRKIYP